MRARVIVIVIALLALSAVVHAYPAGGQVVFTTTASLGMGFSPGSITPIADGIPVYASGDQLWMESYSSEAVSIGIDGANGTLVVRDILLPNSPGLVYSFSSADLAGSWSVLVFPSGGAGSPTLVAQFELVGNQSIPPSMTGYQLTGNGELSMNFTLDSPGAYNIGACLVGSAPPSTAIVPMPSGLGSGQLDLVREGDQVAVTLNGKVAAPFTFWTELHSDYSYTYGTNATTISRDMLVAATNPINVPVNFTSATTSLQDELNMRTGRFSMWTFFESAGGLSVYQEPLLIAGNLTWISLDGCVTLASNLAPVFSLSAPLSQPPSTWPREIYVMYDFDGVDMFSAAPIPVTPAAIRVVASPWNETFSDAELSVVGSEEEPLQEFSIVGSIIFVTDEQYPVIVQVGIYPSAVETINIPQPFSINNLTVGSGEVVVETEADGKPVSGVGVTVSEGGGMVATGSSANGATTFYILPGSYTVAGVYENATSTVAVYVGDGLQSSVTLDFRGASQKSAGQLLSDLLIFTAIAGLVISITVWVRAYRNRPPK